MKILINESQYVRIMEDIQIEPSKTAVKNICTAEKFCSTQGKITFGQLRALVDAGKKERLVKHIGEGGFKALIRIIPWFFPQIAIAGFIGSTARAMNKLFKPAEAVDAPVPPLATSIVPTKVWSAFQSLGRTRLVSASSGIVLTLLCLTVIAIIEPLQFCRSHLVLLAWVG